MRALRRPFQAILSRLLVALLIVVGFQATGFTPISPAQASDSPGSIDFVNVADGPSALTTTLSEAPGTGDLTYEFWFKLTNSGGWPTEYDLFSTQSAPNATDGFRVLYSGGQISVYSGETYLAGMDRFGTENVWTHIVFMRKGASDWMIYKNGACRTTFTLSSTTSTKLTLGSETASAFRGKIANFRYAKSTLYDPTFASYVPNESRFTPPLTALTATPETKVLLNTVQGVNFAVDTSATPNTFTLSAANPPTTSTDTPLPIFAKFESNGGSGSMANQVSNVSANLSSNSFTKSGFTFYGWNTAENGTGTPYKNGATYGFTSSITLHAQWSSNSVAVNFDSDGGSAITATSVVIGSAIPSAPTPPEKSGYTFDGWKATDGGSAVSFPYYPILTRTYATSVTSAALVDLGRYEHKGLWVSSTWYGPNRGTTPASTRDFVTYSDGAKYVAIRESNNSELSNPLRMDGYYLIPLDTSTTLTAIWTPLLNTITYDLNGGSGTTPTQADVETDGTFTTAETPVRNGWSFDGWSDGSSVIDANTPYTVGTSAVTLTAQWTALTHSITYDLNDGGVGTAPTQADVETDGSFTTAETPVRTGWTFNGWSDGSTTFEAETSYTVGASAVTLTALWTRNALSVTFDSQNWQTEIITSTEPGTSATAPSDPTWYGYNFKGWSETPDGAVVGVSTVTIFGAKTFYAIWEQRSLVGLTGLSAPDILNAHSTLDRTVISSLGTASTTVKVPGGALPDTFQVRVYTLPDDSFATQVLGAGTFIISQVVAWSDTAAESFGNIQDTAEGKPIEITFTSPDIKVGAKVYSVLGNISTLLGTATQRGSVTVTISQDPVIIVEAAPADDNSSGGSNPEPTVTPPEVGPSDTAGKTPKAVNFTGFNPNSWALTKAIKTAINKFFKQIATPTKVRCVGNTVGPKILKRFKKISYQRGKVVCNYIAKNFAENAEIVISGVPLKFVDNRYRRTRVVLSY